MNQATIQVSNLSVSYGQKQILHDISLSVPAHTVTTLIGPNGCGKSTLLKGIAGLLHIDGEVELAGKPMQHYSRSERAQLLSMLPQSPLAPDGLSVEQLVARGRHPHQSWLRQWSPTDAQKVQEALAITGLEELRTRPLHALSGGQRQRVWIALILAQDTDTVLLDEPTTYLDLSHSIEILRLVRTLSREAGKTVLMVLHDLNLAARYSDQLIAVTKKGTLAAHGRPEEVLTAQTLKTIFDIDAAVIENPIQGGPLVIPKE